MRFCWPKMRVVRYYCTVKVVMGLLPLSVIGYLFLYVLVFSRSIAKMITLEEMESELVGVNTSGQENGTARRCELVRLSDETALRLPEREVSEAALDSLSSRLNLRPGGGWTPSTCLPLFQVALIVPYRDRISHLRDFLAYIHPFLQLQALDYRIFVVEQTDRRPFNRAKLFNVGFKEAEKLVDFPCYIFHDVDLIPQNINNIYGCTKLPRHMSPNIDIFNYKIPYDDLLGGAVAILKEQFLDVNGFSNSFFGWGGEDDDFFKRVTRNGSKICRYVPSVSRYVMLSHKKEKPSDDRYYFLQTGKYRYTTDGLNSLKYTVLALDLFPLYTRILVDL